MTTAKDFCNWLQGVLDASDLSQPMPKARIDTIQKKLSEAFTDEIDPSFPPEKQAALHAAHRPETIADIIADIITWDGEKKYVNSVLMGKDGKTPDTGLHWDKNSWNYEPGARC